MIIGKDIHSNSIGCFNIIVMVTVISWNFEAEGNKHTIPNLLKADCIQEKILLMQPKTLCQGFSSLR